jgi:hypothetical protein
MKLKYFISIVLLIAFAFNSCDKVEPPYIESRDYCSGNKKVLIEDYTGHGCVNCPSAAVLAHDLKEQFCERIVIIGVHAGYFAQPDFEGNPIFSDDFTTEAGNIWDSYFGNSAMGNPNGLVDRVEFNGSQVIFPQSWGEVADQLLTEPAQALLTLYNDFDDASKTLTTTVTTEFQQDLDGDYKLIVCITEDNIIAAQKNNDAEIGPTPIDSTYVHNHVLRTTMNGVWGESITGSGNVAMETPYQKTYSLVIPDGWKPEDCHVVAFVYNDAGKQVLQVEEMAVIE